jgi:hypothetical protein
MGTVLRPIEPVDQDFLDGLIVRWKLAEQYVVDLEMNSLPAETASKILMQLLNDAVAARVKLEGSDTHSPQFPQAVLFAAV